MPSIPNVQMVLQPPRVLSESALQRTYFDSSSGRTVLLGGTGQFYTSHQQPTVHTRTHTGCTEQSAGSLCTMTPACLCPHAVGCTVPICTPVSVCPMPLGTLRNSSHAESS